MDAEYECSLNEEDQKRAIKELNEDPTNRLGAVQKLREWIQSQPHIEYPTDTKILLMYLRHAKYSQLRAREVIEKNCQNRDIDKYIFGQQDPLDEDLISIFKAGSFILLPGRGSQGQKRILMRAGATAGKKWHGKNKVMIKALFMLFNYILMEEYVQVCGIEYLVDFTSMSFDHMITKDVSAVKLIGHHYSNTLPLRLKGRNYYNESPVIDGIIAVVNALTSKKLKKRMRFHGQNLENVYKVFPKECLPVEYLPDDYTGPNAGTWQSLADDLVSRLQQPHVRAYLMHLTSPEWRVDLSKKPTDEAAGQTFRKLDAF